MYILKKNKYIHQHSHMVPRDYPGIIEGKNYLRASPLSLFLSLYYSNFSQYNIRYLPTSKTLFSKLELENHGHKTIC